jgi:hypothetical protein
MAMRAIVIEDHGARAGAEESGGPGVPVYLLRFSTTCL